MAKDIKTLVELSICAANGKGYRTNTETFSKEDVDASLREEFKQLAGSVNEFMKNRYDIYQIIIETADEIVPKKVESALGAFAEIQTVGQGQKAVFKRRVGRRRAKTFLTQVGLSGVYETFRLDNNYFELGGHAVGGGATIDFERFLDGAEDMAELMEIISEGLTDAVFGEVQKALRAALKAKGRPDANRVIASKFDAAAMQKLIGVVKAYGTGAAIFATEEFVAEMGPDAIVPGTTSYQGVYAPSDLEDIHNTGYVRVFRGTPIVLLPQSYTDESNTTTCIDPQLAYVLPTGGEKVVKVVLEGNTQINDFKNRDNSMEIYAYKKMGAAILTHYNWGIFQNTGIAQTYVER